MNKVILMGRLTKDPETRATSGDTNVTTFSLAVDRKYSRNGEKETDFFFCTSFGKQADFVYKYLKQGTKIILTGRIQIDNYTNKDGVKVKSTNIIAEDIEFAESKNAGSQPKTQSENTDSNGWMSIPEGIDEELPFC